MEHPLWSVEGSEKCTLWVRRFGEGPLSRDRLATHLSSTLGYKITSMLPLTGFLNYYTLTTFFASGKFKNNEKKFTKEIV